MINQILLWVIVFFSKIAVFVIKSLKLGGGTSIVGYIIEKKLSFLLKIMAKDFEKVVFISGTNGKTTTRAIINKILDFEGVKVVTNIGGANIVRGVASSLILNLDLFLKPKAKFAVFEIEEASLPKITKYIKPDYLILTNIFRDQLDVYGEISTTSKYFIDSLKISKPILIINHDDPMLKPVVQFAAFNGLEIMSVSLDENYSKNIKWENPAMNNDFVLVLEPFLKVIKITQNNQRSELQITSPALIHKLSTVYTQLDGVYNIYNLAFAVAFGLESGVGIELINKALADFKGVFGRNEIIKINECELDIKLIKNPAGCDLVLDQVNLNSNEDFILCCLLNDNTADGKDVSWIWDSEFEKLAQNNHISKILVGGSRVFDMALRLDHANLNIDKNDCFESLQSVVEYISKLQTKVVVVATYTAMMGFRKELSNKTEVNNFFEGGN